MIAPNADLRCTAMQAMADSYWQAPKKDAVANMHSPYQIYITWISFALYLPSRLCRTRLKLYIHDLGWFREGYGQIAEHDAFYMESCQGWEGEHQ